MTNTNKPNLWTRLKALFKRLGTACAFLDGKGCACAGQGLIHELELSAKARRKQAAEGAQSASPDDSHKPQD